MTTVNEPQEPQQPDTTTGQPPEPAPVPEPGTEPAGEDETGEASPGNTSDMW